MTFRSKVLLLLIVLGVLGAFLLAFVLLSTIPKNNNSNDNQTTEEENSNPPVSNPVSFPNGNDNSKESFKYAYVNNKGNIALLNTSAEEVTINIEDKKWKDISWNPSGDLISVLGQTSENTYNLFTYSLSSKEWNQVSSFTKEQKGVDGYVWKDESTIVFMQGEVPERWLHSVDIRNQGQIAKLNKVDGTLVRENSNSTRLVFKKNFTDLISVYFITTINGEFIYRFDQISNQDSKLINVQDVMFNETGEKLLLKAAISSDVNIYDAFFGSREAFVIKPEEKDLNLICNVSGDIYLSYKINKTKFELFAINAEKDTVTSTAALNLAENDKISHVTCFESNNVLLKLESKDTIKWLALDANRQFIEFESLKGNGEVAVNPVN